MANTGSGKQILGQGDVWGGKLFNVVDYTSSTTSYSTTAFETLVPSTFGFFNTILAVIDISMDQTGTYYAQAQPVNSGLTAWKLQWFVVATGAPVGTGVNLNNITVKISAVGY